MGFRDKKEKKDLAKQCQKCNADLKKDFEFCPKCGTNKAVVLNNDEKQQGVSVIENEISKEGNIDFRETPEEIQPETVLKKTIMEKSQIDFSDITRQLNAINNRLLQFNQLQGNLNNIGNMLNNLKQSITSCFENQQSNVRMQELKFRLSELFNHLQQQIQNGVDEIKRNIPQKNDEVLQQYYQEILKAIASNEHQNELMSKQYQEIQKLRGNFYADLLLPAISDIIEIVDDAKRIFSLVTKESDYIKKMYIYDSQLKAHIVFSDGKLKNRSISTYESRQQDIFDDSRHKITEIVKTTESDLHNKVAESVNSGYIWNISDSRSEIIRKEEVKIFQYNELLTKKTEIR